jgi:hypothetical protein
MKFLAAFGTEGPAAPGKSSVGISTERRKGKTLKNTIGGL